MPFVSAMATRERKQKVNAELRRSHHGPLHANRYTARRYWRQRRFQLDGNTPKRCRFSTTVALLPLGNGDLSPIDQATKEFDATFAIVLSYPRSPDTGRCFEANPGRETLLSPSDSARQKIAHPR